MRCSSVFDADGAFCPTLDEAATDFVAADKVILAVGQRVDREWFKDCLAPEAGAARGAFVCGDAESGPATVVEAIASGRRAAASVHRLALLTGAELAAWSSPAESRSGAPAGAESIATGRGGRRATARSAEATCDASGGRGRRRCAGRLRLQATVQGRQVQATVQGRARCVAARSPKRRDAV